VGGRETRLYTAFVCVDVISVWLDVNVLVQAWRRLHKRPVVLEPAHKGWKKSDGSLPKRKNDRAELLATCVFRIYQAQDDVPTGVRAACAGLYGSIMK